MKPFSASPRWNAATMAGVSRAIAVENPTTGSAGCCARAASGHDGRAAKNQDEIAPPHSITSSVRSRTLGGTSRPKPLATNPLTMSSNLVGRSIGKSPGFAPLNILSTYTAARR